MRRFLLIALLLGTPQAGFAGECLSATNFYVVKQERFDAGS